MSGSSGKSRSGKDVARRRVALERVRSRVAEEREAAKAARRRRESELDELAVDFELATQDVGGSRRRSRRRCRGSGRGVRRGCGRRGWWWPWVGWARRWRGVGAGWGCLRSG